MKNSQSKKKNIVSKNDQLKVILEIMGKQTEEDISFISDGSAVGYVNSLNGS
jgi:hypothetical protein